MVEAKQLKLSAGRQATLEEIMTTLSWYGGDLLKNVSGLGGIRLLLGILRKVVTMRMCLPNNQEIEGKVLFFQSLMRDDYDEFIDNVAGAFGTDSILFRADLTDVRFLRSNCTEAIGKKAWLKRFTGLMRLGWSHRSLWHRCCSERGCLLATWLYLHFLKFYLDLAPLVAAKPQSVVVFAEMQPLDRILSMLCLKAGIPCGTLQHGLYVEYTDTETVNRFNYQPLFVSDFFAWGGYMADLVGRYAASVRVTVCGKPTLKELVKPAGEPEYDAVLMMDQNIFEAQNQEMIDLVWELLGAGDCRLGIRFHPANLKENYRLHAFEVVEGDGWLKAKCCIGHTTSFLVDILQTGMPVYRYATDAESAIKDSRIEFSTLAELKALFSREKPDFQAVLQSFISKRGEAAIEAHREAIFNMSVSKAA